MFGSIKKAVAVAAVVGVGALSVSPMASAAPDWTVNGVPLAAGVTTPFTASGPLTLSAPGGLQVVNCQVSFTGMIENVAGGPGINRIDTATFATPCSTNIPGCVAIQTATVPGPSTLPWASALRYDGLDIRDDVVNVKFWRSFSGCPAPIPNGVPASEAGTLSPLVLPGVLRFDGVAAGTLTGPLGSATVRGDVTVSSPLVLGAS